MDFLLRKEGGAESVASRRLKIWKVPYTKDLLTKSFKGSGG